MDSITNELMVNNAFDLLSSVTMPKNQKEIKHFFVPLPGTYNIDSGCASAVRPTEQSVPNAL